MLGIQVVARDDAFAFGIVAARARACRRHEYDALLDRFGALFAHRFGDASGARAGRDDPFGPASNKSADGA
ncbi:hypothetical protein D1872_304630 [compost metagenome]